MSDKENFSFNECFKIGDIINGFCNGFFGRDDYNKKVVDYVTNSYVVFKYIDGDDYTILTINDIIEDGELITVFDISIYETFKKWMLPETNIMD